jgi:DNA-binding NarL/FixJ family response regulator
MPPWTVFIADDVESLRALLRARLEEEPDIEIVGEASTGPETVTGVIRTRPDVLLLDLSMPEMDGLEALAALARAAPGTRTLVVSGFTADRMAPLVMARGASGYFEKGAAIDDLPEAIRELGPAERASRAV